jgi:hypothetical protein
MAISVQTALNGDSLVSNTIVVRGNPSASLAYRCDQMYLLRHVLVVRDRTILATVGIMHSSRSRPRLVTRPVHAQTCEIDNGV